VTSVEQSGEFPRIDPESSLSAGSRKGGRSGPEKAPDADEHFGAYLRRAREEKGFTLAFLAERTKVSRTTLMFLEAGRIADLPAPVYVRGFIRSYARAIGLGEADPLLLFERAIEARDTAERVKASIPVPSEDNVAAAGEGIDDGAGARRGVGLAVFVIILLLIATITLSFFLRRPPSSGEGLSFLGRASSAAVVATTAQESADQG
jgi:cytoskeleton protein RodZ